MGKMYQANCECSYSLFDLLSGCGMTGVSFDLLYCEDCNHVFSRKTIVKSRKCSSCRSDNLKVIDTDFIILKCPICSQKKLEVGIAGKWD
ncbi:hypothetical protein MNBD_GAMMA25-1241 [hydrothermal vent metagenome]|uniref:Uncharacterized protein n=1 Tax=hydrothermal vent metagenome TaxID=652676 RepID=A0A3B1BYN4_9ZZZZ